VTSLIIIYGDYSVNSGYECDVKTTSDNPGILSYQYELTAPPNIASEPNLQLGAATENRSVTYDDHVVSSTTVNMQQFTLYQLQYLLK